MWNKIDNEIKSLNDDQRNILFSDKNYISIDTQLKILVQEALVNSVKDVIENSEIGNKLLTQQLNLIKTNKDKNYLLNKYIFEIYDKKIIFII